MADLYIIGQILSASDFVEPNLFCVWSLQFGKNWTCVEGENKSTYQLPVFNTPCLPGTTEGQSITDISRVVDNQSIFIHPLDIHLSSLSIQGWPKLHVEVWTKNSLNQCWPVGYGVAHIPSQPGKHRLTISTWKLTTNSLWDEVTDKFHGGGFSLNKSDFIYSGSDRYRITTKTSGSVSVDLMIVLQNFSKYGIEV